ISSIDNESVKSIEGVISDITNKEVLISFESELASLKSHYQRLIKNYARKLNSLDLEAVAENIAIKEKELKESKLKIASINTKIPPLEQNILTISERLRELEPSRKIEIELVGATRDLKHYEDNYEKDLGSFRSLMSSEGAYMLINKLTNNLESIINNTDVPLGLNVKIVENILERDSCICGNTFNDHMRQSLFELNKKLPPNDINITIKEQCKIIQSNAKKTKENLKKLYKSMDENYQSIEETKNNVNALKTKLTESVDNIVVKLEVERAKLEDKLNAMKSEKEGL